ncbi:MULTISPECIES: peptidylprolyl isomerase [Acinetobacter]|uniref:peptidylprolyl isomerase n=1 Tax=Acinetobacter TaxID=469 RepID=UPI00028E2CFD|nr:MULTISPECIES: peptidylprolyl isomerase [Acinetobacter]MDQ9823493.1 peptidylprolyl isomerase [Acinetobacter sp. 163]SSQ41794.1 peptidyl-prolyl cis-trans isomerase [Acinetobacter baumannii]EKF46511.1 peptidyl-prolyl cis-trans isomerase [Acinetobacter nosocomialis Ab22222]EKU62553.1 peptidyl-prolyl cis-trans isomerase A [Acinetobacter nosocomialis]ELW80171.1 peptidyl-prolyl cis-trans isomerase A [Acinetobacter sp. OIFC021]
MKKLLMLFCLGLSSHSVWANSLVEMQTNLGNIEIELYDDKAPISVNNFKSYIKSGFYKETIFHRVIPGFMAQGGGMTANMQEKTTRAPIKNEAGNGIANTRGTLAMARTSDPDSATSQFFINVADNKFLNRSPGNPGYAVFGKVVKGMDVVDRIVQVPTSNYGMHQNVPKQPIKIVDIKIKTTGK